MRNIVVFDLDNTLSDARHRNHLVPKPEDASKCLAWEAHYSAAGEDKPIQDNIDLLNRLAGGDTFIVVLTGRCELATWLTISWLERHGVSYDKLIMMPYDDERPDTLYKEEELLNLGLDNILCCFDDLEHVAEMIRGLGVTCHLVTKHTERLVSTTDNSEWGKLDG